jgi:hypothetical protein
MPNIHIHFPTADEVIGTTVGENSQQRIPRRFKAPFDARIPPLADGGGEYSSDGYNRSLKLRRTSDDGLDIRKQHYQRHKQQSQYHLQQYGVPAHAEAASKHLAAATAFRTGNPEAPKLSNDAWKSTQKAEPGHRIPRPFPINDYGTSEGAAKRNGGSYQEGMRRAGKLPQDYPDDIKAGSNTRSQPRLQERQEYEGYNDEYEGFEKLEHSLAHKKGIHNPAAVAASIGRKKYGAKGMAKKAAAGRDSHGHVIPRRDGIKARCGGPGICRDCKAEWKDVYGADYPNKSGKHIHLHMD